MKSLRKVLKKRLSDAGRIVLVGIGSQFRGDDRCGLIVAEGVRKARLPGRRVRVLIGATAPENLTGEIKRLNPGHVILVDAADIGKRPGTARLIDPAGARGVCFCTHQIPLQIMADYLVKSIGCGVTIIGIQAKALSFGSPLTPVVARASAELAKTLISVFRSLETPAIRKKKKPLSRQE